MKLFFAVILSLLSFSLIGQQANTEMVVTGVIHDADSHNPLPYTTVTLKNINTKKILTEFTTKTGEFQFTIPSGKYYFKTASQSFKPFIINALKVDQDIYIGIIELTQNSEELDEIKIVAKNNLIEYKFDKKIYHASKDIANAGGNAITVLENTPSVFVDEEGGITVRGGSASVLVNGKPYGGQQSNADILSLIPANSINKVEILTRSAKHSAEGGSVINIILKKEKGEGYNGSIEVHGGIPDNDGASTFFNYKNDKLNLYSTASFNHRVRLKKKDIQQTFLANNGSPHSSFDQKRKNEQQKNSFLFNIGSDFYLNKKNTLTTSILYSNSNKNYDSDFYQNDFEPINILKRSSFRDVRDNTDEEFMEIYVSFTTKFNEKGHELSIDASYDKNSFINNTFITDTETFPSTDFYNQKSINDQFFYNYSFKVDYSLPFKNNSLLEIGHKSNFRIYDNDYMASNLNQTTQLYEPIPDFFNKINYNENIYAFYVNYSKEGEKISYILGLRTEVSETEIIDENKNTNTPNNYTDLFPSALISYYFENESSLALSYERSIKRPSIMELNPFTSFNNERFFLIGNPYLEAYYTNFYLLEYHHGFEKLSLNAAFYYSNSNDKIAAIIEKTGNQTGEGYDIFRRVFVNHGTYNYTAFELELVYYPSKKLSLYGMVSPYLADVTNTKNNLYDYNGFIWVGNFKGSYKFTDSFRIQLSYKYQSPIKTAITDFGTYQYANASISKDLFKGKATLNFKVTDIFHSKKAVYKSFEANTISNSSFIYDTQYLLSFTYRFNNSKKRNAKNRSKDIDKNIFEIEE